MAKWTMKGEGETISDGASNLKLGAHPYKITSAERKPIKSDPTGKSFHIVVGLSMIGATHTCNTFFAVESDSDIRREIAEKELRTLWQASGNSGDLNEVKLKKLIDTCVVIEAKENEKAGKKYVNIASIEPYTGEEGESAEEEEEESEEEETEEEEPEETPAPAASGKDKKKPWE